MDTDISDQISSVEAAIVDCNIQQYAPPHGLAQHYGFMKFDSDERDDSTRLSQYIRLSLDNSAEQVVKFMKDGWQLPTPNLIISITGGAKNFEMSARLRKVFQRGLVSAAVTTNAWIITAGTNAGVVREVGQALNNYRYKNRKDDFIIPCIGIASWGYTAGNEQLEGPHLTLPINNAPTTRLTKTLTRFTQTQSLNNLRMGFGDQSRVRTYIVKDRPEKRCELEATHTHFLLLDDGQPKADNVLQLRADIEKHSRAIDLEPSREEAEKTLIPIVMILVDGGPSSVRTICQALESNTPVVVVKDSGRYADLVAELHAYYCENDSGSNANPHRGQANPGKGGARETDIIANWVKEQTENPRIEEVKADLCRILNEHRQLVTVFKFDSKRHNGNLEDAILEGLFNAAKVFDTSNDRHRRRVELQLAMAWHKFRYAQKHILSDTTISKWKEGDLRRALVDALRRGHVNFVELLIEFGTPLEKLTHADLKYLYETASTCDRLPVRGRGRHARLSKSEFYSDYFKPFNVPSSDLQAITNVETQLGRNAPRDLFLWALFLDRFELATYLCSKTWNPSVAPLVGAYIYRRAGRITLDSDQKQQCEDNANQFDLHSMAIIDRCFDSDDSFAVDLLKRPASSFYDADVLVLARIADCRSFLASKCVQKHLDNQWFGNINYKRTAINFRVFLCSLFLPLFPLFCFFLPYVNKHQTSGKTRNRSKVSQPTKVQNSKHRLERNNQIDWIAKIIYFYQAPIVRFYYYTIFFVIFLVLFSFVLLVDYFPLNNYGGRRSGFLHLQIPITEMILHICLWSLIVEEVRQFFSMKSKREYFSEVWNLLDVLAIGLYLVGFITRFIFLQSLFTISKIFLCLDLIVWYVRTLHLFAAYEKLGPKLIMIIDTMKDLLFFVCFIAIFLLGFSITSWALLATPTQVGWFYNSDGSLHNVTVEGGGSGLWTWQLLHDVTNYGVWKIFGQVDPIDGTDSYSAVTFVLAILFVAIANVLLLNVLVALFNVTIQNVAKESHRLWRFQRFRLVFEYTDKPPLPPPFNTLYYLIILIKYLSKSARTRCTRFRQGNQTKVSDQPDTNAVEEEFRINDPMLRESAIADDYWRYTLEHGRQDPVEVALQNIERKLHDLKERIQTNNIQTTNVDHQLLSSEA